MPKPETLPVAASQEFIPATLQNSGHYVGNDLFIQEIQGVREEIHALVEGMEPWLAKAVEMSAREGATERTLTRTIRKQKKQIMDGLKTLPARQLYAYYKHLDLMLIGRNKLMRQQMLERMAVENEKINPNVALKCLAEINRMTEDPKGKGGGQTFQIVITNNVLQKGPLDV